VDRTIVRLGEEHREAAAQTLAEAFFDDPAMGWMMPEPAQRRRSLLKLTRWMVAEHLANAFVLGTPGCEVVTLWRPPGTMHLKTPLWHPASLRFLPIFGRHVWRAALVDEAIHRHLPADDRWLYLRMAGVRPDHQGKGLGGLAIRAGIAEALRLGVPVVLETATESNLALYRSLGFETSREWTVPRGGPRFWTMTRGE
jgi:GNAT superfamily N-acetyltransferase